MELGFAGRGAEFELLWASKSDLLYWSSQYSVMEQKISRLSICLQRRLAKQTRSYGRPLVYVLCTELLK
jgi:hypothetical protein